MAVSMWGATTTIYDETFGSGVASNTDWSKASNYFSNDQTSTIGSTTTWKVSKSATSPCDVTGSSEGSHVFSGTSGATLVLTLGDLSGYKDVTFTCNFANNASAKNNSPRTLTIKISGDGGETWSNDLIGANSNQSWQAFSYDIPNSSLGNLVVQFTNTASNTSRIDDIKFIGTVKTDDPGSTKTLDNIAVTTAPTKTIYTEGEKFTPAGLKITADYGTDGKEDITYAGNESKFTFAPALTEALATTHTKVTITYGGKSVDQAITVNTTPALTTMDEIFAAATAAGSTATDTKITFNNWVISGVKNNNAYLTDNNGKGLIIYQSGHGFAVGNILSGTVRCKVQLYRGSAELTALAKSTDGLTVDDGGIVTPITTATIASLGGVNTGAVYSFSNLSYNGTVFSDGINTLKPYNSLIELPTLNSGSNYNVSGMFVQFDETREIAPRAAADFEEIVETKYNITIAGGIENGSVEASTTQAAEGSTITLTATPSSGYQLSAYDVYKTGDAATKVTVTDGAFTMPAYDVTVSATFEEKPYIPGVDPKVELDFTTNDAWQLPTTSVYSTTANTYNDGTYTISMVGDGNSSNGYKMNSGYLIMGKAGCAMTLPAFDFAVGKIDVVGKSGASGSVVQNIFVGENAASTATTGATGTNTYEIAAEYQGPGNIYTLKVTSSHNTQVTYVKIYENPDYVTYNVNIAGDIENGTVSANVSKAGAGATVTLTATPADGYEFDEWIVKDADEASITVTDDKFTMPAKDVTVSASFKVAAVVTKYAITVAGDIENGNVAVAGDLTEAAENDEITLTVTPADGYEFEAWAVKGADETPITVTDNKFTMPAQAVTISATFRLIPPSYVIYETGFEDEEGFTKTSNYYEEQVQGAANKQWTIYGTATSDDKKTGEQSVQMRISKSLVFGTATNPYAYTNFDLNKVCKVKFAYRTSNTSCFKKFKVQYSLNSGTEWKDAEEIVLDNTNWNANHTVTISEQSATMRIRFLVTEWAQPSSTQKFSIDDIKIYSTEPLPTAINAEDVEIEYNATSGEIAYTIQSPIAETDVVASTEATWLSGFATEETKVTFSAAENDTYVARHATVTLTYGSVVKDITVSQKAAPKPKFAITVTPGVNGSVSADLSEAEEGAEVTLTITPNTGYILDVLTVVDATDAPVSVVDNKFTMPAKNVTVSATFKVKPEVIVELPHTGTFNKTVYTDGWVTNATGTGTNNCVVVGAGEKLTSPKMNMAGYYEIELAFKGRRYGTLSNSKAVVDVAIEGGTSLGTIEFTGTSATASVGSIKFAPTDVMTAVKLVFTCTNATSAGSTHGAGIGEIEIVGKKYDEQPIRENVAIGKIVTMCNAKQIVAMGGAVPYEVEANNGFGIDLVEAEFPLVAGKPYILHVSSPDVYVDYGEEVATEVVEANGLVGNLSTADDNLLLPSIAEAPNCYIILNNHISKASGDNGNYVAPDRAYLNLDLVGAEPVAPAPGRRRITLTPTGTEVATGMENVESSVHVEKVIINGQMYILRAEKMYNAAGLLVK